jgi:antitoxin component HigA of HigAB toxin-antitoxin module
MNEIRIIRTAEEHAAALAEIEQLMKSDPQRDTPEGARLELLALVVEDYERGMFRENSTAVDVRLSEGLMEVLRETGRKCGESAGRVATIVLTFCATSAKAALQIDKTEEE